MSKNLIKIVLISTGILILLTGVGVKAADNPVIYGDRDPTIFLEKQLQRKYNYSERKYAFPNFFKRSGKAIIIHQTGDRLRDSLANKFYDMSLHELDQLTEKRGIFYQQRIIDERPVLLISISKPSDLKKAFNNKSDFIEAVDNIMDKSHSQKSSASKDNLVWESSGYQPRVFKGLFKNPDYSDHSSLLQEDPLTERTPQVKKAVGIMNDNKDLSTLKEIFNLLRAISTEKSPENVFEVTAAKIITTPITGGCTTFATAFAALARAKDIPTVVVDSAKLKWIEKRLQS